MTEYRSIPELDLQDVLLFVRAALGVQVMLTIKRGQHGSTYGGNPVAAKVALAALQVIVDENLVDNSYKLGQLLRHELQAIQSRIITEVRCNITLFYHCCHANALLCSFACLSGAGVSAVLPNAPRCPQATFQNFKACLKGLKMLVASPSV